MIKNTSRSWKPQPWIHRFLSIPRGGKDRNHPRWQTMLGTSGTYTGWLLVWWKNLLLSNFRFFFLFFFLFLRVLRLYATLTVMIDLEVPDWTHGRRFQLCCVRDCWRAVLLSRSFGHFSLTYRWLWTAESISRVTSAFLFHMFWRNLWGTCMSSSGVSREGSVAARSNCVARKASSRVIFSV